MNLSNLTKEQKQYIILGAIVVVSLGAGLIFGVGKLTSSMSADKAELEDLSSKVERAERTLSGYGKIKTSFEQTILELEEHLDNVPPDQNYYSWATEIIYTKGRSVGLEIESVDEIGMSGGQKTDPSSPVYFEVYSLRVTARGGYQQVEDFLNTIEEHYPLVRFSGLEISRGQLPEVHNVQLFVQWPFKLNRIAKLWEGESIGQQTKVAKNVPAIEPASAVKKPVSEPTPEIKAPVPVAAVAKPAPAPVVAPDPEPIVKAPKPVVKVRQPTPPPPKREPVPEVVKPAPVAAVAKPAPAPVVAPDPEPIVKAPKPVVKVRQPTPPPPKREPVPEVVKPAPVAAVAKPAPAPVVAPDPEPIVKAPEPVVEVKQPAPPPKRAPVPEVVKPAPIVAVAKPAPAPVVAPDPEPVVEIVEPAQEPVQLDSILASMDAEEGDSKSEVPSADENFSSLLASLGSHGTDAPEPVEEEPVPQQDDLAAYVQQLEETPIEVEEPAPEIIEQVEVVEVPRADVPVRYESSSKSAKILEELLKKGKPKVSGSLGSFLDGIVEDINDN
jgi:hypothetical protein